MKINGEFKLGIRQIPRWGVFGGYRNHLHVGAPLLLALSADEFCALLAHEIAHLGGENAGSERGSIARAKRGTSCRPSLPDPANAFDRVLAYLSSLVRAMVLRLQLRAGAQS